MVTFEDMLNADPRSAALNQEERDYIIRSQAAGARDAEGVEEYLSQRYREETGIGGRLFQQPIQMSAPVSYSAPSYSPQSFNNSPPPLPITPEKIIKTPDRFLSVFTPDTTDSILEKLLFENIGGIEIVNIERHDTIEGKNPYYSIISNLSAIKDRLDPITLVARQRAGLKPGDFGKQINLSTKIPLDNYLTDINLTDYIFIDTDVNSETYGSLIIELVEIAVDELIEVEIAYNGTIYEIGAEQ
jgi:hypothetical protein